MIRLQRALERYRRRERMTEYRALQRMLLWDRAANEFLLGMGLRPVPTGPGETVWTPAIGDA